MPHSRVAILTDFVQHDPAYSLCGVVANQVKMLRANDIMPRVIARHKDEPMRQVYGEDIWLLDPGEIGQNVVNVTSNSEDEISKLEQQLKTALKDIDIVLTHDLIYQANMWKYHVAAKRVARSSDVQWLHWVHSSTDIGTKEKAGRFNKDLEGYFPNSRLVVMHNEEVLRKGGIYGYEVGDIVEIPNPLDIMEDYHPVAKAALEGMHKADVIAVYPCRLDRGKQPHIIIDIFAQLKKMGYDARIIIVDFHSTAGDKATYRDEMKGRARQDHIPIVFTSDLPDAEYHIPHKAVMDLFDYADVLVHPSRSESDPLIVPEAAWKRCGMVLNFDLPVFRQYDGKAIMGKFSSTIDVLTSMPGETITHYDNREAYMRTMAASIAYMTGNNWSLSNHIAVRKTRSLEAVWERNLWPIVEGRV